MPTDILFQDTSSRTLQLAVASSPLARRMEPSEGYAPPYERPLEDEFAWHLVKYLNPIEGLGYQEKVNTPCGSLWVDFVVEHHGRRIGFEIGSLDEETTTQQECYQHALLLGSGTLDVLYHFRGKDLYYRLHDVIHLVAQWDAELFSSRGHINLKTLASQEARACHPRPEDSIARVLYGDRSEASLDEVSEIPPVLVVRRLSRSNPGTWIRDYDKALDYFGVSDEYLPKLAG